MKITDFSVSRKHACISQIELLNHIKHKNKSKPQYLQCCNNNLDNCLTFLQTFIEILFVRSLLVSAFFEYSEMHTCESVWFIHCAQGELLILELGFVIVSFHSDESSIFTRSFPSDRGCPRGVMVEAMDNGIVVSEFVLHLRFYFHFRASTLGKGMNPLILPAMG